jgi:hypothetical protein
MNRLAVSVVIVLTLNLALTSVNAHGVRAAVRVSYFVNGLTMPKVAISAVAHGINGRGLAVGTSVFNSGVKAEIWRLNAAGAEMSRSDVPPPRGYVGAELNAVNDKGVAVGTVHTGPDSSGSEAQFPALYYGRRWTLLASTAKLGPTTGDAVAIATNGVTALWASNPTTHHDRAATARPATNGEYRNYQFLPLSAGAVSSRPSSVFSTGGITLVGGYEELPAPGGQVTDRPVFWVNGKGPYAIHTAGLASNLPNFGVTGVYGTGPAHVFVVGFSFENDSGVTATEGFTAAIDVAGKTPVSSKAKALPLPGDATFASAASIGGGPAGERKLFTIGGDFSDWAGATNAALWTISGTTRGVSVKSIVDLSQAGYSADSMCPMYEVESLNATGDGVGYEYCNGETSPMVVTWRR